MRILLTSIATAALATVLSTGSYAQDNAESRAAPKAQSKETVRGADDNVPKTTGAASKASSGAAMKGQTTGSRNTEPVEGGGTTLNQETELEGGAK